MYALLLSTFRVIYVHTEREKHTERRNKNMWSEGSIKIGSNIIRYWIKHFEEASVFGIEEGRISKLMLKCAGRVIANYDRGWDIEPSGNDAEIALAILMEKYN